MGWLRKDYLGKVCYGKVYILRNNQLRLQIDYIMQDNKFYVHKNPKLETELDKLQVYPHSKISKFQSKCIQTRWNSTRPITQIALC